MMMKYFLFILAFVFWPHIFYAQAPVQEAKSINNDILVSLKTEQTLFSYGNPINLQLIVLNRNYKEAFLLGEKYFLNYYLEVFSEDGVSIQEKDEFFSSRFQEMETLKRKNAVNPKNVKAQFKIFMIKPQDLTGIKVNLLDMYDLKPGKYLLRLKFYPASVFYNPLNVYYSSYIQIIIEDREERQEQDLKERQWQEEKSRIKTPQDTIKLFFDSKKNADWDRFFYTLDLKGLINIFNEFHSAYISAKDSDKNSILNDFKIYLKDVNSDERIINWEIEETTIRKNQALVTVIVHSMIRGIDIGREYLFRLEKRNHWYIQEYSVVENNKFEN
jgi:hypothetical protein